MMSEPPATLRAGSPHDQRNLLWSDECDESLSGRGYLPPPIRELDRGSVTYRAVERASEVHASEREPSSRLPTVPETSHRTDAEASAFASTPRRNWIPSRTNHGDRSGLSSEASHHTAQGARHISAPWRGVVLETEPSTETHTQTRRELALTRLTHDRGRSAQVRSRGDVIGSTV